MKSAQLHIFKDSTRLDSILISRPFKPYNRFKDIRNNVLELESKGVNSWERDEINGITDEEYNHVYSFKYQLTLVA